MKILFLDDDSFRTVHAQKCLIGHDVYYVNAAAQAIALIGVHKFDLMSLDHDLGGKQFVDSEDEEGTGYHVAQAIAALPKGQQPELVIVHSYNPGGAQRMVECIESAGIEACRAPFGGIIWDSLLKVTH